jgi:hypothetical protein
MHHSRIMAININDQLRRELEDAAFDRRMGLCTFISEILEVHAATRRMPKVRCQAPAPGNATQEPQGFPWPADTYRFHGPR